MQPSHVVKNTLPKEQSAFDKKRGQAEKQNSLSPSTCLEASSYWLVTYIILYQVTNLFIQHFNVKF